MFIVIFGFISYRISLIYGHGLLKNIYFINIYIHTSTFLNLTYFLKYIWRNSCPPPPHLQWAMATSFTKFLDHTQRRITVGRTALDE